MGSSPRRWLSRAKALRRPRRNVGPAYKKYIRERKKIDKVLVAAYEEAIKKRTKELSFDEANRLKKELEKFRSSPRTAAGVLQAKMRPRPLGKHEKVVLGLDVSSSGRLVISASADGTVVLWDLKKRRRVNLGAHRDKVAKAVFSPRGKLAASVGYDGTVRF